MHVHAEDQQLPDQVLHLILEQLVALHLGDPLVLPVGERVGAGRGDPQPLRFEQPGQAAPQPQHLGPRLPDVGADPGPHLDHRLQHLGPHVVHQRAGPGRGQQGVDVGLELPTGVDDLELFLDADRERLLAHSEPPRAGCCQQHARPEGLGTRGEL
jgi:hypothetical protein